MAIIGFHHAAISTPNLDRLAALEARAHPGRGE
jgi:hypothetical protein